MSLNLIPKNEREILDGRQKVLNPRDAQEEQAEIYIPRNKPIGYDIPYGEEQW
jgi:hypothetical protein